jgi:hypothetical protein
MSYRDGGAPVKTCRRGHPQTPENLYKRSDGRTQCKPCRRMSDQARYNASKVPPLPLPEACPYGHPYTPENLAPRTDGGSRCRTCRNMSKVQRRKLRRGQQREAEQLAMPIIPERETLEEWVTRVYRRPHEQALENQALGEGKPATPDLFEVMAHGGHCPTIIGSSSLDAWSADLECGHGRVPAEFCKHGCHAG